METPSSSQRRRTNTNSLNSPEFEFWSISSNKPEPLTAPLHSADELFSHGFLLPLHFLPLSRTEPDPDPTPSSSKPSALITSEPSSNANPILSASKRWTFIFRKISGNNTNDYSPDNNSNSNSNSNNKVDNKRRGNKCKKNNNGPASAELNINIWPFSRSRSAGNNSNRSNKPASSNRKVSSAPCSRSNSSRRSTFGPSSPSRAGVHLGRASPVWQVKKSGPGNRTGKVNRQHLNCRSDESGALKSSGRNGNLFGFRGLFSKKCNSTVLTV